MRVPFLVILTAFLLAACGQSEPPAKGGTGPPGPIGPPGSAGPPGPSASGPAIRIITQPCYKRPAARVAERMSKFSMHTRLIPEARSAL